MRLALVAAALVAVLPSPARACEPPICWGGAFLPADGATVPANLPGIVWQPMSFASNAPDPTQVELRDDAGNAIALTASPIAQSANVLLVPATALVAGTHYQLVDRTACRDFAGNDLSAQYPGPRAGFTAAAAAPLPTSLGDTLATDEGVGTISTGTSAGSCSVDISADRATLMLALAPSAQPWQDVLIYATSVDGQRWSAASSINQLTPPGQSWTGRATDRVFARCADATGSEDAGLPTGPHLGLFSATLPGTSVALTAGTASFTLTCPTTGVPDPGDDQPAPDGGGCSTGAGTGVASLLLLGLLRRRATR